MIGMAGRCLAISSQQKRVIEVEYWRVYSEKRRHKDPLVYDSQAGRKAPPVSAVSSFTLHQSFVNVRIHLDLPNWVFQAL